MQTNDILSALVEARALIAKGWTQDAHARDRQGCAVFHTSDAAVTFCANGAMLRVSPSRVMPVIRALFDVLPGQDDHTFEAAAVSRWNDERGRTKEEVIDAFDRAIARLTP